jgi:hypothetical protein
MAIERHQELIMDYAGKAGNEKLLFVFIFGGLGGAGTYVQEVGERKRKTSREETHSWKMNTPVSFS